MEFEIYLCKGIQWKLKEEIWYEVHENGITVI